MTESTLGDDIVGMIMSKETMSFEESDSMWAALLLLIRLIS